MKLSVSLASHDVEILDAYVKESGVGSRSAAVQHAVRLLGQTGLEQDYAAAWQEWEASGDAEAWAVTVNDGLRDAAR